MTTPHSSSGAAKGANAAEKVKEPFRGGDSKAEELRHGINAFANNLVKPKHDKTAHHEPHPVGGETVVHHEPHPVGGETVVHHEKHPKPVHHETHPTGPGHEPDVGGSTGFSKDSKKAGDAIKSLTEKASDKVAGPEKTDKAKMKLAEGADKLEARAAERTEPKEKKPYTTQGPLP